MEGDVPTELLPDETGLINADTYDGEVVRMDPKDKRAAERSKVMVQKFARTAAMRLQSFRDPTAMTSNALL